jgi:hypothetical protein
MNGSERYVQEAYEAVEIEFNRRYPYLRLKITGKRRRGAASDPAVTLGAAGKNDVGADNILNEKIGLSDSMRVIDLERALQCHFGVPVETFRKNGRLWLKISHTNQWTVKVQNEQGIEFDKFH